MTTCNAQEQSLILDLTSRQGWVEAARGLLAPLKPLMEKGSCSLAIGEMSSSHDARADRLESFARPFLLAAYWAQAAAESAERTEIMQWFARGVQLGVKGGWGDPANYHQHVVESGVLVLALEMTHDMVWDSYSPAEKEAVASWLSRCRATSYHFNNHMFFGVMPLCFLNSHGYGRKGDAQLIANLLDKLENMAVGGGWFRDGMNETVDYYNAYAFHYYGLLWGHFYGKTAPARRKRWRNQASEFIRTYREFFADSGENPPFGRSMCYRFAACAPFALACLEGCSPIDPAEARSICADNLRYYLERDIDNPNGTQSVGLLRPLDAVREKYNCSASPYWSAKGFSALLIPEGHDFWQTGKSPLRCCENRTTVIADTGLVVRRIAGEVEIINTDTAIFGGNLHFGAYKWGKLGYRSGVGLEAAAEGETFSADNSLSFVDGSGNLYGRHQTHRIWLDDKHAVFAYAMGNKDSGVNVQLQSQLFWRGGWVLQVHSVESNRAGELLLNSYSLPFTDKNIAPETKGPLDVLYNSSHYAALQNICGFTASSCRRGNGNHTHSPFSASLQLSCNINRTDAGAGIFAALTYCGKGEPKGWEIVYSKEKALVLENALGDKWDIRSEFLPGLPVLMEQKE